MKKLFLLFSALMTTMLLYAESKVYLDDFSIKRGETKALSIKLKNEGVLKGMQMLITLPEGLTFTGEEEEEADFGEESRLSAGLSCALQDTEKRVLQVVFLATKKKDYLAVGDGEIFI